MRTLLDACVALNLIATDRFDAIANALNTTFVMADIAAAESLYLVDIVDGVTERTAIDLQIHVDKNSLALAELTGDTELETFVELTEQVDDGEASSLAIALNRRLAFATDDRKATRLACELGLQTPDTTPAILNRYANAARLNADQVRLLLLTVERRASYHPPRRSPEFRWWQTQTS